MLGSGRGRWQLRTDEVCRGTATRRSRRGWALVIAALFATSLGVGTSPPALGAADRELLNGDLEDVNNDDHADHWEETNKWDFKPGDLMYVDEVTPANSQVGARWLDDGDPGSIWTNDLTSHDGDHSTVIYPDWDADFADAPPVLIQEIPTAYLAGRNPTIEGAWLRSSGSSLGIKVTLKYATTSGTPEEGVWNDTNCVHTDSTNSGTWETFSFSCTSALPSDKLWEPHLIIEPTGTFASTHAIRVDALDVDAGTAQTFTAGSWTSLASTAFNAIPGTADLIGTSTRYSANEPSVSNGVMREVYAMESDGTNATRLTTTGYGYGPVTVNPIDHTQVAVVRYTIDWNGDDQNVILVDPARVYILDLDEDKEIAITPTYWSSGLGGVEWTTDGKYVVFGVSPGRYWEIWKADAEDDFALSKVTNDDDAACYESDVNVANFSRWIAYRKSAVVDGQCYAPLTRGDLVLIHPDDPANSQTVVYDDSPTGVADDGLPFGAYDPGFSADDTELIFSYSLPDDHLITDGDSHDSYDTYTVPIDITLPADDNDLDFLFGFHSLLPDADWTWALTPTISWNPSVPQDEQGIVFEIEWDDTNEEYDYWGPSTFDPTDGGAYTEVETITPEYKGLGYAHWLIAGHHDPTSNSAPGGSGTGFDWNPTNIYAEDGAEAGALVAENQSHILYDFNVEDSVASSSTIDGIRVRLQGARVNGNAGSPHVDVALSWDDGTSWTSTDASATWTTTATDLFVGGTADTWGRTWSPSEMDNLRVKVTFDCNSTCSLRNWFVDNVDVRVFWQQ